MDLKAVDEVLTTTRSVRRRIDFERPVEPRVIEECIGLAVQAPTGIHQAHSAVILKRLPRLQMPGRTFCFSIHLIAQRIAGY